MQKIIYKINEFDKILKVILPLLQEFNITIFNGDVGVGKTTLIKWIVEELLDNKNTFSPTYSILNTYSAEGITKQIHHIDLYRLNSIKEVLDTGIIENFSTSQNELFFIEWPDVIIELIPNKFLEIKLFYIDQETRELQLIKHNENTAHLY